MVSRPARTAWVGRNSKGPSEAFEGLADGCSIHGLSDGTWSLIDGIEELLDRCGPSDVTVSTWTAANADIERAEGLLQDGRIKTLRLLVDRSFESRQPRYCGRARHLFGDQALRVWNSHAKFVLVLSGKIDVLYTTSANLNANKRLENFTLFAGGDLPGQYLVAVEELWELQRPGEAFEGGSFLGRAHTDEILGVEKLMRRAELAAAIGRSAKQINKLVDAGMPVARRGARGAPHGYRLEDVEAWLAARDETMQPGEFFDAVRERALKERAQRHLAEQTLKVRAGDLVAKDEVIAEWSGHAAAVRTKLVAIPSMLDIDAKTTGALDALIRQVLEELADGNDDPLVTEKTSSRARSKRRVKRNAKRSGVRVGRSRKRAAKRKTIRKVKA